VGGATPPETHNKYIYINGLKPTDSAAQVELSEVLDTGSLLLTTKEVDITKFYLKIPFYKDANEITNNQFNQLKALKNKLRWLRRQVSPSYCGAGNEYPDYQDSRLPEYLEKAEKEVSEIIETYEPPNDQLWARLLNSFAAWGLFYTYSYFEDQTSAISLEGFGSTIAWEIAFTLLFTPLSYPLSNVCKTFDSWCTDDDRHKCRSLPTKFQEMKDGSYKAYLLERKHMARQYSNIIKPLKWACKGEGIPEEPPHLKQDSVRKQVREVLRVFAVLLFLDRGWGYFPLVMGQPDSMNVFFAHLGMVVKLIRNGLDKKVFQGCEVEFYYCPRDEVDIYHQSFAALIAYKMVSQVILETSINLINHRTNFEWRAEFCKKRDAENKKLKGCKKFRFFLKNQVFPCILAGLVAGFLPVKLPSKI
jgi:hypothetical protein